MSKKRGDLQDPAVERSPETRKTATEATGVAGGRRDTDLRMTREKGERRSAKSSSEDVVRDREDGCNGGRSGGGEHQSMREREPESHHDGGGDED